MTVKVVDSKVGHVNVFNKTQISEQKNKVHLKI